MQTRTRTQSVVFTDMADYTRSVASADRQGLRDLLSMHQRFVEPVLTGRGGRVVKNIGDSFMALFDSATDAVRASLDLVEAHAPTQGSPVTFRASIATGDVEEAANDAFGEPVNLSARINARTPAGEVWLSTATWYCMNQSEIPWESTGRHRLKGIVGEVEVFRAVPKHFTHLPEVLTVAVRARTLVTWQAGEPLPPIPPGGHLLLSGFRPGSQALTDALDRLPIVDPAHIWLATYNISPADRMEWARHGRGLVVATPDALKSAVQALQQQTVRAAGSDTIILDSAGTSVADLVVAGLALPMVPLAEVVASYTYDLLPDGRWVNRSDRAVVRVEVSGASATATVLGPGVLVDRQIAAVNSVWPLVDGMELATTAGTLRYTALQQDAYLGALVGDTQMRLPVGAGQRIELGREPSHPGLLLPDRNNQDNIRWCAGPRAARARERGFTLDKVLTGRRQTSLETDGSRYIVNPMHETCPTLLLDSQGTLTRITEARAVNIGDAMLLGTTVVALRDVAN